MVQTLVKQDETKLLICIMLFFSATIYYQIHHPLTFTAVALGDITKGLLVIVDASSQGFPLYTLMMLCMFLSLRFRPFGLVGR